ncbi:MAG: ABC transporter ATP-binding protein [Kordiimonadaceae bacterium]|nr:ABC transporter ATP-binding protein [Kordiimonadaceae bacterium]MBO6567408.1 ABC transporter ATP-binding protein [Kordiimonadaceae bacterium]MBO6963378.1 ABC transporter ATP-binding protein [Kordiimonadaceae bacterium]
MAEIHLKDIAHAYVPGEYALKSMDHIWQDGSAYALLGPSGCGKTTLLNIISGLLKPSEGQVLFDGKDVTGADTAHRNIAQVFQFPVIYDTMTVRENLAFPLKNRGMAPADINGRVEEVAGLLEISDRLDSRATGLTADAKQIISLGRGLVRTDVNAILFDEPLTVIDPHLKWQIRSKLKDLHRQFSHTMVYVTHDQTEALTFADKVVVMNAGEVLQVGTPEDLFERPAHTFVGYFIGSPGMNFLDVELDGSRAVLGDQSIDLKQAPAKKSGVQLGIRPEFLDFADQGISCQVTSLEDLGRHRIASVSISGQSAKVIVPSGKPVPSENAMLSFDPDHTLLYTDGYLEESLR